MEESILNTIKNMLDISDDDTAFDKELIDYINSALFILYQLGVSDAPFTITGSDETWSELLDDVDKYGIIKQYIYLKVKKVFDSSGSGSSFQSALDNMISEYEWRINMEFDPMK